MKKAVIILIVTVLVLITTGLWFFSNKQDFSSIDIMPFGIIILLIGFAVFVGYRKYSNVKRGEPTEDELSKKILQRASSTAYYISLYMWLAFSYFSDKTKMAIHSFIAAGILGMAIIFCICWIIYNLRGVRDE
jgi:peptidoglycan/LPS O-acetylase OafA/YrhL